MKLPLILSIALATVLPTQAQHANFNGLLVSQETGLRLHLDLDAETIEVPGMSFIGETHGYLDGISNNHVYGVWMLIHHKIEGNTVKLRFSNDLGGDSQDILLKQVNDSTFSYTAMGGNAIRKVEDGRRLVKIPSTMTLQRKHD